jgi:lysozyme|tara:strand:+ start:589 stop:1050 length:462 start_codon:yes stop_codon:yes gene_type:complete
MTISIHRNTEPVDIVAEFESFEPEAYYATEWEKEQNILTIGYGDTQSGKLTITEEEAREDLKERLEDLDEILVDVIDVSLRKNERTAIISLVDNIGIGAFKRSRALQALNNGDFEEFHNQAFSEENGWVNQNGKPLKGLVRRRETEGNLFNLA